MQILPFESTLTLNLLHLFPTLLRGRQHLKFAKVSKCNTEKRNYVFNCTKPIINQKSSLFHCDDINFVSTLAYGIIVVALTALSRRRKHSKQFSQNRSEKFNYK